MRRSTLVKLAMALLGWMLFVSANPRKSMLEISLRDCRNDSHAYLEKLTLRKDGKVISVLTGISDYESPQKVMGLDTGTYTLEYTSIFKKGEKIKVVIEAGRDYEVEICSNYIDYSQETYQPVIDRLQEDESYTIVMLSSGCFHYYTDSLTICRHGDGYQATMHSTDRRFVPVASKLLTPEDIEIIRQFEIELNYMDQRGGCTSRTYYLLTYRDKQLQIGDGTCKWNGESFLNKQLQLKKRYDG